MREVAPLLCRVRSAVLSCRARRSLDRSPILSKHNCLRLRGRGPASQPPWRLGPQEPSESAAHQREFSGQRHPDARHGGGARSGIGLRSPSLCSSLVSHGRAEARLAGMRVAARTHLHSLREPQASCRAREGFREFHARASSQQSRSDVGPATLLAPFVACREISAG